MEYSRFERLVVGVTALLILGTIAASVLSGSANYVEVIGQLMILFVLGAAAHWGRRGGTIAALAACLVYLLLQLPLLSSGLSGPALLLIVSRLVGYCLIGIVGGEAFGRVKYLFAASSNSGVIDDWSRVYNQRYAARALQQAIARHERYQEPFSVVIVTLAPDATADLKAERLRAQIRNVANFLRDDVRMVDDVARLDDGRFVVMLPHTAGNFAPIVASRLADGVRGVIGVKDGGVTTTCLGADEHGPQLAQLLAAINTEPEIEPVPAPAT